MVAGDIAVNESSRLIVGSILIAFGLICIWVGDRKLPLKGGVVLKLVSHPEGQMRWLKWPMAIAAIWAGLAVIFHW